MIGTGMSGMALRISWVRHGYEDICSGTLLTVSADEVISEPPQEKSSLKKCS